MTRVGRTPVAVLLAGGLAMPVLAGCGGGKDFQDKPRPAAPVELSGVITDSTVTVEPSKIGAGPITILISNQSKQSHTVTLEGGPHNTTEQVGPINPLDAARIQETVQQGTYTVKAGSEQAATKMIKPATLHVGPRRQSSSGQVLLP